MNTIDWELLRSKMSLTLDQQRFDTWFKPLRQMPSDNSNELILQAPNRFVRDFLHQHYTESVLNTGKEIFPALSSVSFIVADESPQQASTGSVLHHNAQRSDKQRNASLSPQYTFDLFVVGPANQFARSVSFAVAESPGKTKFNPLLIYGGVGLGKTHLLHAIGNYILDTIKDSTVNCATSEQFYFDFIDAIKNNDTKSFSERYRQSDVLLVDDIQFLAGKESTQEEFFYVFNTLYQNDKQIVLTSDLPPASLKGLQDRLISRFQWGLCVDIQPPSLETRMAIIQRKAERDNLNVPEDVLYYIAENVSSNIRELEGILIKLLAFASISNTDITLDTIKTILKQGQSSGKSSPTIDQIIEIVAQYYSIPVNNVREKNRRKEVALCRQVAMYIAKSLTNYSLKSIGLHFGGRDHSTVIHAVNNIEEAKKKDKGLADDINYILSQFA